MLRDGAAVRFKIFSRNESAALATVAREKAPQSMQGGLKRGPREHPEGACFGGPSGAVYGPLFDSP